MPIRIQTPAGVVEFPDDTDPQTIEAALREQFPAVASHETNVEPAPIPPPETPTGFHAVPGGRSSGGYDVRKSDKWARDNAPVIGATLATTATGGGALPLIAAATLGGAGGSALRGDDLSTIATEGATQGALQGTLSALKPALEMVARGFMKGTVSKNIAKEFDQVDIPQEMLNRNVFPGVKPSQRAVSRASTAANAERDAAAQAVPTMSRRKIIEGLRPIHQKATAGKAIEMSDDALDYMRTSAREVGKEGLTGPQALARKDIKQLQGRAALGSGNARAAASTPGLADAERSAIVSHLRETPRMATALNESQTLMALDQVMKDAALSNPVTRMRIGGLPSAALTPVGLGTTAHVVNQGSKLSDPRLARALMMLLGERSNEQ